MAEVINTNVFDATKKFVDFAGLDYFWEKAKAYVDGVDTAMDGRVSALETTVSDENTGLVKKVADLQATVDALGDIEGGEGLGGMIDAKIAALDVNDTAVAGQYVSAVSEVDGKVVVTRADLPVYEEVGVAKDFNDAMDARVKVLEAIDHDKLATDAAASAVAGVIDGAPEKFDTLKEIAQWISDSETADSAADLVNRVKALEDADDYVKADVDAAIADAKKAGTDAATALDTYKGEMTTALADKADKSVVDGLVTTVGNAESGLVKDVADLKAQDVYVKANVDKQVSDAQAAAIAQAKLDAAATLVDYYKKSETYSKTEVDNLLSTNSVADQAYAKTYTDQLFNSFQFAQNSDIDSLFA